jgi:hypothetical protein
MILEVEIVPNKKWQNAVVCNGIVFPIYGGDAAQEHTSRIAISEREKVECTYLGTTKVVMQDVYQLTYNWLQKNPTYNVLKKSTCIHFVLCCIEDLFGKNAEKPLSKARAKLRRLSTLVPLFAWR